MTANQRQSNNRVYTDNAMNRKLGRVGLKIGSLPTLTGKEPTQMSPLQTEIEFKTPAKMVDTAKNLSLMPRAPRKSIMTRGDVNLQSPSNVFLQSRAQSNGSPESEELMEDSTTIISSNLSGHGKNKLVVGKHVDYSPENSGMNMRQLNDLQTYSLILPKVTGVTISNGFEELAKKRNLKGGGRVRDPFREEVDPEVLLPAINGILDNVNVSGVNYTPEAAGRGFTEMEMTAGRIKRKKNARNAKSSKIMKKVKNGSEPKPKPEVSKLALRRLPPLIIHDAIFEYVKKKLDALRCDYEIAWGMDTFRVVPKSYDAREKVEAVVAECGGHFYTFTEKCLRPRSYLIRGLPSFYDCHRILSCLQKLALKDVEFISVDRVVTKASLVGGSPSGLFKLKARSKKADELLNCKLIDRMRVKIVPFVAERDVLQCYKCQRVGHTSVNCQMPRRCVKCTLPHGKEQCQVNRQNGRQFLKCALCNGKHTANSSVCSVRNAEIIKIKLKQQALNVEFWKEKGRGEVLGPNFPEKEAFVPKITARWMRQEVLGPIIPEKEAVVSKRNSREVLGPKIPEKEATAHNIKEANEHNKVLGPKNHEKEAYEPNEEAIEAIGEVQRLFGRSMKALVELSM